MKIKDIENNHKVSADLELNNEYHTTNEKEIFKIIKRRKFLKEELNRFVELSQNGQFKYSDVENLLKCVKSAKKEIRIKNNKKVQVFEKELRALPRECFENITPYLEKYFNANEKEICFNAVLYTSDYRIDNVCPYKVIIDDVAFNWHTYLVDSLGKLEYVWGDLSLYNISKMPNLLRVEGSVNFKGSKITNLNKLKHIGEDLICSNSGVENLCDLEYVGGSAYLKNTKIKDLGKLKYVGGNLDIRGICASDFKNLKYVGGELILDDLKNIVNVDNLQVDGTIYYVGDNKKLQTISYDNLLKVAHSNQEYLQEKKENLLDNISLHK